MSFVGKDFLKMKPPPGYVAGVGRGAVGFTSQSRLGSAKRNAETVEDGQFDDAENDTDDNGLLATGKKGVDDISAEQIWAKVDARKQKRRKKIASARQAMGERITTIAAQFADLKPELEVVTESQWLSFPEATDLTRKNKRLRQEERDTRRSYAVPDTIIDAQAKANSAEDEMLASNLANVERLRPVFERLVKLEPKNPEGWIGLARLEEESLRPRQAKAVINRACIHCASSPEVWLESIKLHSARPVEARAVAGRAVEACPRDRRLWQRAIDLATSAPAKLQLVHRALETISDDADLWILAVDLETDAETRVEVLKTAVEVVTDNPELWMRLIDLEPNDQGPIQKALDMIPSDKSNKQFLLKILVRSHDESTLKRCIQIIADTKHSWSRETRQNWLKSLGELENNHIAARMLVEALELGSGDAALLGNLSPSEKKIVFDYIPEEEDLYLQLCEDSDSQHLLREAIERFPHSIELWKRYLCAASTDAIQKALEHNSDNYEMWVIAAEHSKPESRAKLLHDAVKKHPDEPRLWCKLVQAIRAEGDSKQAIKAAEEAMEKHKSFARLHLLLIELGTSLELSPDAIPDEDPLKPSVLIANATATKQLIKKRAILDRASKKYPRNELVWLEQLRLETKGGPNYTRILAQSLRECPQSGLLWFENLVATPHFQRKSEIAKAVSATNGNEYVLLAAGLHCYAAKRPVQGAEFLKKAIAKNENNGDVWLWAFCYIEDHRLPKIVPEEGPAWMSIRNEPANEFKSGHDAIELLVRNAHSSDDNPFLS